MTPSSPDPGIFSSQRPAQHEPRSPWPLVIAGVVVLAVVAAIVAFTHQAPPANPGGAGLAPAAPYASSLAISHIQMSQATNALGGQSTYLDGQIANRGHKTVTAITVQVAFIGFTNQLVGKPAMPLNLIRTREPYIDTEPVSADPILPGQTRNFRLIFDSIPQDWNQNYPEVRIIQVATR